MKGPYVLFFVIGILGSIRSLAQPGIIKGKVSDRETRKPLPFASVYINYTTYGTTTDTDGSYLLDHLPTGEQELVVSFIGYRSYHAKINVNDSIPTVLNITLQPETTQLHEVQVNSTKDEEWKRNYQKFLRLFFGKSPYAASCKIYNPWVLEFKDESAGDLTATAAAPLAIENDGLGYNITYQLTDFRAGLLSYTITGYVHFREMVSQDTTLLSLWRKHRTDAYTGSYRQLFKAMVDSCVTQSGFILYRDVSGIKPLVRDAEFPINLDKNIVPFAASVAHDSITKLYTLKLPSRIEIHYAFKETQNSIYKSINNPISWIETQGGYITVNKNGIVQNPDKMFVLGAMSDSRVAEILPYDYVPPFQSPCDQPVIAVQQKQKKFSALASLVEQPYVQTDRPYYYRGEPVYFKAYQNYVMPALSDSLSHVLYIDLIDTTGTILQRKELRLTNGMAEGSLILPAKIHPGNYEIRAFTRWMMNFDPHFVFTKPLKILADDDFAKSDWVFQKNIADRVEIVCDSVFHPRQKITLVLHAHNYYGYTIPSNLSVSVTDQQLAWPPENELTILKHFPIDTQYLPDTSFKKLTYPVQYGIDFSGQLVNRNGKPKEGELTVFQKGSTDVFNVKTDANGKFNNYLNFNDSVNFLVQARTNNGRKARVIMDPPDTLAPPMLPVVPLALHEYVTVNDTINQLVQVLNRIRLLGDVTVRANRIKPIPPEKKSLMGDITLSRETIQNASMDLLDLLQSRVPGLRVTHFVDKNMRVHKRLVLSGSTSFSGITECLVIVDGLELTETGFETVADQLEDMSAFSLESINVERFGGAAEYGARGANGVIKVTTGNGGEDKPGTTVPPNCQPVPLTGFVTPVAFSSPDYGKDTTANEKVDARETIYWNPNVQTDSAASDTLTFYAADLPSRYRIVVEGIDSNGAPVRGEKMIEITPWPEGKDKDN